MNVAKIDTQDGSLSAECSAHNVRFYLEAEERIIYLDVDPKEAEAWARQIIGVVQAHEREQVRPKWWDPSWCASL